MININNLLVNNANYLSLYLYVFLKMAVTKNGTSESFFDYVNRQQVKFGQKISTNTLA
jgi:hypothetical protein